MSASRRTLPTKINMTSKFLKVASINTQRILQDSRLATLKNFCIDQGFDVVGLQEVRFHNVLNFEPHYNLITNHETERGGTAFLIKKELKFKNIVKEAEGRVLTLEIEDITFVNIYAPAGKTQKEERNSFYQSTLPSFIPMDRSSTILFGDFNAVDNITDRMSNTGARNESVCKSLVTLTSSFDLVDCWKRLHPEHLGHSYYHQKGSSRLDRFYASKNLSPLVKTIELQPVVFSDHHCLSISIENRKQESRKTPKTLRIWKMNTAILEEEDYSVRIHTFINEARKHQLHSSDIRKWWDEIFKTGIKKLTIDYCRQRSQLLRATRSFYQQCLTDITATAPENEEYMADYRELKDCSRTWEEEIMQGAFIRSRVGAGNGAETPSTYHLRREKNCQKKCKITKLTSRNGQLLTTQQHISEEIHDYYAEIFQNTPAMNEFPNPLLQHVGPCPKLDPGKCEMLVKPFEKSEVRRALDKAKKNKAPGVDGIPSEFYSTFWNQLGEEMTDMMNATITHQTTTPTQRLAIIKLIPKNKKPKNITEYRPISLLCADYKLIASTLAIRLSKTLPDTISAQQRGGVPGRKMGKNLTLVRDVTQFLRDRDGKGALISVDFSKAYDMVNRNIVWSTMRKLGYPDQFITYIQALYTKVEMKVYYGEGVTDTIVGNRSIRQGCPLSIHLFALYLEPLLTWLNSELKGIPILNQAAKSFAFVDDVNIFAGSDKDIDKTWMTLENFCNWTGAVVNQNKTHIMGLGTWCDITDWRASWAKPATEIKILGITFFSTIEATIDHAWTKTCQMIAGLIAESRTRSMTIHQRVRFLKEHIVSKAVYVAQILPCPEKTSEKILACMTSFVWEGSIERTKRTVLHQQPSMGGIGLPHPGSMFKYLFLKTNHAIMCGEDCVEKRLLTFWLAFPLRNFVNGYQKNEMPYSIISYPWWFTSIVKEIKVLGEQGLINKVDRSFNHRPAYQKKLEEISTKGKMESRLPNLNWNNIWKHTQKLPQHLRDLMFRLNHDILPTRERQKKTKQRTDDTCTGCKTEVETAEHLFVNCQQRKHVSNWLLVKMEDMGFTQIPCEQVIRLCFPQTENTPTACHLVAKYVNTVWKYRRRNNPHGTQRF